jgi:hypothetical protein
VIEKIISIGSPAKRLCLLELKSGSLESPLPQALIASNGEEAGKLTSFSSPFALAILKRNHHTPGTELRAGPMHFTLVKVSS